KGISNSRGEWHFALSRLQCGGCGRTVRCSGSQATRSAVFTYDGEIACTTNEPAGRTPSFETAVLPARSNRDAGKGPPRFHSAAPGASSPPPGRHVMYSVPWQMTAKADL